MNVIKYILGIYGLCNILSDTSAMNIPDIRSYITDTTPAVHVIHNTVNKQINLDGVISCSLLVAADQYNGIELYKPLWLHGDMSQDEIISAIKKSFGPSVNVTVSDQ